MLNECMCTHVHVIPTCTHTYVYTYTLHLRFPLHRLIMGLQNHIAVLLANPTEVRHGEGDDNLWSQLSPKSAEKGVKPLPLCLSLLMLCSGKVSTLPALWSTMEVAASHPSLL